jgi:hypothetical protein
LLSLKRKVPNAVDNPAGGEVAGGEVAGGEVAGGDSIGRDSRGSGWESSDCGVTLISIPEKVWCTMRGTPAWEAAWQARWKLSTGRETRT